ncbi:MAG: substrate-binding domain-containing protein, partial [Spirochaetales bacterium]|nr:substrate-binding domain-containing protein [Spirochaetales bacterium]
TSTENSGLLAELIPPFEDRTGLKVDVIAVGTGQALKLGETGDVDLVLVHARASEDAFVAAGHGVDRRDVMHNDFIILGPSRDPAGVRDMGNAAEALKAIANRRVSFISRGDDSGTHKKEKALWKQAGLSPKGRWYRDVGQGMGAVITMSDDMQAYTLADRGTYLSMKSKIALEVLVEGDPKLFNPYGIIAVNPAKHPHVNYNGAMRFIAWITSPEGQNIIGAVQREGQVLFYPDALK